MRALTHKLLFLSALLLAALVAPLASRATGNAQQQAVTITLPDNVLLQSLRNALPIPINSSSDSVRGVISIDTINDLQIHKDYIALQGLVTGKDLAVKANIAGQDLEINIGSVQLPLKCNILLRFDRKQKTLFITPKFNNPKQAQVGDPATALYPLLAALDGKEFPLQLNSIDPFNAKIGDRDIPIRLDAMNVTALENHLLMQLIPVVNATR